MSCDLKLAIIVAFFAWLWFSTRQNSGVRHRPNRLKKSKKAKKLATPHHARKQKRSKKTKRYQRILCGRVVRKRGLRYIANRHEYCRNNRRWKARLYGYRVRVCMIPESKTNGEMRNTHMKHTGIIEPASIDYLRAEDATCVSGNGLDSVDLHDSMLELGKEMRFHGSLFPPEDIFCAG